MIRPKNALPMSCRLEHQIEIEPQLLELFQSDDPHAFFIGDDYEFANPNYSENYSVDGSESLNSIDTAVARNATLPPQLESTLQNLRVSGNGKRRQMYASLRAADMGVPAPPPLTDDDSAAALSLSDEQTDYSASERSFADDDPTMAVDARSHSFGRSFAAIDEASRGGGVRVRRDGDTTVTTEHRDPYSFYWQLDQARRPPSPPPPRRPTPPDEGDNAVDEIVAGNSYVRSPDSHDSGIQVEYLRSNERPPPAARSRLPGGWERHEDPNGYSYYWHVDSGTIRRDNPGVHTSQNANEGSVTGSSSTTDDSEAVAESAAARPDAQVIEERGFRQTTVKRRVESSADADTLDGPKPVRFAVRSLGWTDIAEEELTPERSSRAVNRAIVDLSTGRNDLIDNVAKWGDGKELIMELDDHDLRLLDPDSGALLHSQPIHQIRVWGVGRDNSRDFAYVARDRNSRRFMCHVFRCDTPARTIANTLRDICKRLMLERRPNSLNAARDSADRRHNHARETSLPTPMEEPKKVIRCHFLGATHVPRATGIEILNGAVDRLVAGQRADHWLLVDVSVAPSTIVISEVGGNQIDECRVRYLSFLGIGKDIKHCAFIMHSAADNYMCYVFHVEPSAGAMAKTIEAACKLRYQKVLDGNVVRPAPPPIQQKGWSDTIRDVFGNISGRVSYNRGYAR